MLTIRSIKRMQKTARAIAGSGRSVGLVPTMGYLHRGHLSLISRARREADVVIVSLFVNPTQFGPHEDFQAYPRNEKSDKLKIKSAGGDILFIPRAQDIYPEDFQSWVTVEKLTQILEGKARPTHFRGVTTVVAKLFNITRPDVAIFGQKDFQQAVVLRRMTYDLGYPIKFVVSPTIRDKGGLALSSRNSYFTPKQRKEALGLFKALRTAKQMARAGMKKTGPIKKRMRSIILSSSPSAKIEYIAFNNLSTLAEVKMMVPGTMCSLAVQIHKVRLIDNMKLL